MTGIQCSFERY